MKVSIVVPCYNEENNINPIFKRFVLLRERLPHDDLELILVDNGSADNTGTMIDRIVSDCVWVKKVEIKNNKGYGYGIIKGLEVGSGDALGWIHADLQFDPLFFLPMIKAARKEGGDYLYKGKRKKRPVVDCFFTICMGLYESIILRTFLWDINAQPTLISRKFYQSLSNAPMDFSLDLFVYYMAKKEEVNLKRFPAEQKKRMHGESSWNTGMGARIRLIRRVMKYSSDLRRRFE